MLPFALGSAAACLALVGAVASCSAVAPSSGARGDFARATSSRFASAGAAGDHAARAPRVAVADLTGADVFYLARCPSGMASVDGRFCIDRWEASLVEVLEGGDERPWSAFRPVDGHVVRAVTQPGVPPQGYISAVQASDACKLAGKRLCRPMEWRTACVGSKPTRFGYGDKQVPRRCNDYGSSPVIRTFGLNGMTHRGWGWDKLNAPSLNQMSRTVAPTGAHEDCTNDFGVYDMVGNLHEWVADPKGAFYGGYFQDTTSQGEGCTYQTVAHSPRYHDYSTGFRCCADVTR
jgi:hypothetical protein